MPCVPTAASKRFHGCRRIESRHRSTGFIKLALRTGAEIVPVYFFGNTSVLSVLSTPLLRSFARLTGVTLTWFWGVGGTLVRAAAPVAAITSLPCSAVQPSTACSRTLAHPAIPATGAATQQAAGCPREAARAALHAHP